MVGEAWAIASAICYGLASAAILKGKENAVGDNGIFLSAVVTLLGTSAAWLVIGDPIDGDVPTNMKALLLFACAGLASIVFGRWTMFRATETIGPTNANLVRRLTPVAALPLGTVVFQQYPSAAELFGGALILLATIWYQWATQSRTSLQLTGVLIGVASAGFYALAYTLRGLGLESIPDPLFGTMIGAAVGLAWLGAVAFVKRSLKFDMGPWQIITAICLSAGQTSQFIAVAHAKITIVAVLGALDVVFGAMFATVVGLRTENHRYALVLATALTLLGSALVVSWA